jgi:hypothetical protein
MRLGTNYLLSCKKILLQVDERSKTLASVSILCCGKGDGRTFTSDTAQSDRSLVFECILQSG